MACAYLGASTDSLIALRASSRRGAHAHPIADYQGVRRHPAGPLAARVCRFECPGALSLSLLVWWAFGVAPQKHATVEATATFHFSTRHGEQRPLAV